MTYEQDYYIAISCEVYAAAEQTVVVVTPPSSDSTKPSAADFFSMIPANSLKAIGLFPTITGLAVTSWSSVLYINTGTGIHAFMFDGTPLWSTLVQFNDGFMNSPGPMVSCAHNLTDCLFIGTPAVDQCDGSIYVARSDGWLYAFASWQPFLRWRYDLKVSARMTAIRVTSGNNGHVYVATVENSMVYAISTKLGTLLWQAKVGPLDTRSCIPVVDLSGWVSIGSLDGFLYVISPDGTHLNRYLAYDILSPVAIQTAPILDCSGRAVYVAQLKVKSKTIQQVDGLEVVSFTQSWGTNIWMLVPSTGEVLWSTWYPGLFPAALLMKDLSSYEIDSNWLLAVSAAASNNRQIITFSISITVIFLILLVLSILLYCAWKKQQRIHRQRLCKFLRSERFRHPQGLLLRRRKAYEQTLKYLQAKLELEPHSTQILDQLQATLEGLHFTKRYLALYPTDTLLDVHRNKLLSESRPLPESPSSSTESEGSSCCAKAFLQNFVFERIFRSIGKDDFEEEMRLLSTYNDTPAPAEAKRSPLESVRLRIQIEPKEFKIKQSPDSWETEYETRSAEPVHFSPGGFRNPLYRQVEPKVSSPIQERIAPSTLLANEANSAIVTPGS